jgi:hypothetical protein
MLVLLKTMTNIFNFKFFFSLPFLDVGEPFLGAIGRCWLRMEWSTFGLRLATVIEFDKFFELTFIFVFSSLIIDNDESSVIVEINVVPFLSDVEIRFQTSFESNWDKRKKRRKDFIWD